MPRTETTIQRKGSRSRSARLTDRRFIGAFLADCLDSDGRSSRVSQRLVEGVVEPMRQPLLVRNDDLLSSRSILSGPRTTGFEIMIS
jgi:hypothetical protein